MLKILPTVILLWMSSAHLVGTKAWILWPCTEQISQCNFCVMLFTEKCKKCDFLTLWSSRIRLKFLNSSPVLVDLLHKRIILTLILWSSFPTLSFSIVWYSQFDILFSSCLGSKYGSVLLFVVCNVCNCSKCLQLTKQ